MMDRILDADRALFRVVNAVWVNPPLDHALPALGLVGTLGAIRLFLLGGVAVFGGRSGRRTALAGLVALARLRLRGRRRAGEEPRAVPEDAREVESVLERR